MEYFFQDDVQPPAKIATISPPIVRPPLTRIPPPPPSIRPPSIPLQLPPRPPLIKDKLPKTKFGIAIKLGGPKSETSEKTEVKKAPKVASVFNEDDSSDEEEMPVEAKMRMRNVGRETITSSGPNSFGKTKRGFTDTNRLFERQMKEAMDKVSNDEKA